jgi:hypothetical protein
MTTYSTNFGGFVAYKVQSALGTAASGSGGSELRLTGGTMGKLSKAAISSKEIRPDAQQTRGRHGIQSSSGSYTTELSAGSVDSIIEAIMRGTWDGTTNVLINPAAGSLINRYFTIEEYLTDLTAGRVFKDCFWHTMKVSMAPGGLIMFDPSWTGTGAMSVETGAATLTSPTLATSSPMSSMDATLLLNGTPVFDIASFDITVDNGAVAPQVVGSHVSPTVLPGLMQVSLNFTVLCKDTTFFAAHLGETGFALSFQATDGTNNLHIDVPFFTLGSADISPMSTAGGSRNVTVSVPAALVGRDPTTQTMIKFTRV